MVINKMRDLDKLDKDIEYKTDTCMLVHINGDWTCLKTDRPNDFWVVKGPLFADIRSRGYKYGLYLIGEHWIGLITPITVKPSIQELIW